MANNTPEWRERVCAEIEKRGRGAQADIVRAVKKKFPTFSTGQLSELLKDDERPGQKRYSAFIPEIDNYLWPPLLPISHDTHEVKHQLEGIADVDLSLLEVLKGMDREGQRNLAMAILAARKSK